MLARAGGPGAAAAAWSEVLAVSRDHGVTARRGDTVRTTAERMITGHELEGRGRDSLIELGRQVEASWYGGHLPEPETLDPLVTDVREAITARRASLGSRLVPPSVLPGGRDDDATSRSRLSGALSGAWARVRRPVGARLPPRGGDPPDGAERSGAGAGQGTGAGAAADQAPRPDADGLR